jgi:hypothetical protein
MKEKFIEKLLEMPIIQVTSSQTGVHRSTYYKWCETDPEFKKKCREAQSRGVDFLNDMMESILIKNAKADKLTAVIFWLKNHHPQYNDKRYHEHQHYFKDEEDEKLDPEVVERIANAVRAWSSPETGDERDEDYEGWKDDNGDYYEPTMEERQARARGENWNKNKKAIEYDEDGNVK